MCASIHVCVCVCVCMYTNTHTNTHDSKNDRWGSQHNLDIRAQIPADVNEIHTHKYKHKLLTRRIPGHTMHPGHLGILPLPWGRASLLRRGLITGQQETAHSRTALRCLTDCLLPHAYEYVRVCVCVCVRICMYGCLMAHQKEVPPCFTKYIDTHTQSAAQASSLWLRIG